MKGGGMEIIMKRITIVAQGLSDGGAERVASILANYFDSQGYLVQYICVYRKDKEYNLNANILVEYINTDKAGKINRLLERNKKVYRLLKKFKPDRVISFVCHELLFSEIMGIPIIFSLRNDPTKIDSNRIMRYVRSIAYMKAKKIVFQTNGAKNFFNKKIRQKGIIIPNPVDSENFPEWETCIHNKTFISACRLNKQKNLPMLIEAFEIVHASFPDYNLKIYGDGELREELEEIIRKRNLEECIKLMGHNSHIHEIMAESFAFVLSSDYEGLSNAMLEALCVGIPVICTDSPPGGARDYIADGENGLLTPVGNSKELAQKMIMLITDKKMGYKFSLYSKKIKEQLKLSRIGKQWEEVIQ